jgi:hypothetical protein
MSGGARAVFVLALLGMLALAIAACPTSTGGPTPIVDTVVPMYVCDAQNTVTLQIVGTGFSPIVTDTLTGRAHLVLPTVSLTPMGDSGAALVVDSSAIAYVGDTEMDVTVTAGELAPSGATGSAVIYDVTVGNPDGHSDTRPSAFTVFPPPTLDATCLQVTSEICDAGPSTVVIRGTNLRPGASVTIGDNRIPAADIAASDQGTTLTLTLPGHALPDGGPYDVTVTDPEAGACAATLTGSLTVVPPPTIATVTPSSAPTGTKPSLTLTGTGFLGGMTITLSGAGASILLSGLTLGACASGSAPGCTSVTGIADLTGAPQAGYLVNLTNADGCGAWPPAPVFNVTP